ncbi:MAG: hypothetical protein ACI9VR_003895 [Cognaticolwellia sp.]|jgi:hypothetical protein
MHDSGLSTLSTAEAINNADGYNHLGRGLYAAYQEEKREAGQAE